MVDKNQKDILTHLLNTQKFGVIATNDKTIPYTNLVSFECTKDLKNIFFTTLRNTKKYENILKNSKISILVDNRDNKGSDIKNAIVASAIGSANEIVENKDKYKKLLLEKHPYLSDFINSSDSTIININIDKYIFVSGLKKVELLEI
jgi:uncharacterized pyridoxamine 5'-phosphate oxidase family protein